MPRCYGLPVSLTVEQLETEALNLPEPERARLAERLLRSLERELDPEIEQVWAEEAERRHYAMLEAGDEGIPAEQVLDELTASLQ